MTRRPDVPHRTIPFPRSIAPPKNADRFHRLERTGGMLPGPALWWDPTTRRLYTEEECNGPSTWSYYQLPGLPKRAAKNTPQLKFLIDEEQSNE